MADLHITGQEAIVESRLVGAAGETVGRVGGERAVVQGAGFRAASPIIRRVASERAMVERGRLGAATGAGALPLQRVGGIGGERAIVGRSGVEPASVAR